MLAHFPVTWMREARKWETQMKNVWSRENVTSSKLERFGDWSIKTHLKLLKLSISPVSRPMLLLSFTWGYSQGETTSTKWPNNWMTKWNSLRCWVDQYTLYSPLGIQCCPSLTISVLFSFPFSSSSLPLFLSHSFAICYFVFVLWCGAGMTPKTQKWVFEHCMFPCQCFFKYVFR